MSASRTGRKLYRTEREKEIFQVTIAGGVINTVLLVFKFVAGITARSSAMTADAVHSLSDFITDIVVLIFVRISGRPQDKSHDYGHGKFETLASTAIGIALLAVAIGIIVSGAGKVSAWLHGESLEKPGTLAFWAALISIILKEFTYRFTIAAGKKLDSQALKANAWHHRSDAFSSLGTAAGIGCAVLLGDRWTVLDPIASIVVGAFIVKVSLGLMKDGIDELTESSLPDEVENEIIATASSIPDVVEPHHLKTRRIGNSYAIELHVRMDGRISLSEAHDRASQIENELRKKYGEGTHVSIHMEPVGQRTPSQEKSS